VGGGVRAWPRFYELDAMGLLAKCWAGDKVSGSYGAIGLQAITGPATWPSLRCSGALALRAVRLMPDSNRSARNSHPAQCGLVWSSVTKRAVSVGHFVYGAYEPPPVATSPGAKPLAWRYGKGRAIMGWVANNGG